MNYIWEALLLAKKDGIREQELHFAAAEDPSPYIEVSFCDLNTAAITDKTIEVNPLYRFAEIFAELLDRNITEYSQIRTLFLDVLLHYFAHTDLRMGLCKQEFYFRFLLEEMKKGVFGKRAKEGIEMFDPMEQKRIATAFADVCRSGNDLAIFIRLMKNLYDNSIVYISRDRANEILLYTGTAETDRERKRIGFLTDTFLPLGEDVKVFFSEHFGILDVEETMVIDRILLF